eukprot:2628363-Amphidinium_carterae.1
MMFKPTKDLHVILLFNGHVNNSPTRTMHANIDPSQFPPVTEVSAPAFSVGWGDHNHISLLQDTTLFTNRPHVSLTKRKYISQIVP